MDEKNAEFFRVLLLGGYIPGAVRIDNRSANPVMMK
jgi:hypothetical protein